MNAIEAVDLTKRFGSIVAVNGVSFEVKEGEIFGLLGPNGAGKTTTIRMLTGLLKPDRGRAAIMGHDVMEEPIKAKMLIGVVPEEANPYPDLSAWDNLMLVGRLYGLPNSEIKEKATSLLKLLDLYDMKERKAKNLSKGQRQKLLVAMALISDPKVLFLDEPAGGLDVMSARKMRELILELKKESITVFLTTHNIEEAGELCDRVAIIRNGRIVAEGSPDELKISAGAYTYVTITFNKVLDASKLEFLEPYEYRLQSSKLLIVCAKPVEVIIKTIEFAKENGLEILDIKISPPSFEEVFVRLTTGEV
ncbi:MAG: ABC transporter ATP-binding protein [Thaumarchaeota archaeon]|nr:ABC transporter ATP-binding protein [Nitrososphaerota archaeon]